MQVHDESISWEKGWQDRAQFKIGFAALATTIATVRYSWGSDRGILAELPRQLIGYTTAMTAFCVVQESVRALRHKSDYLNSACAGAVVGGGMAGFYQGSRFRLIGALTWGTVSGGLHWIDDTFHPMHSLEDYLIDDGLLDPVVRERRGQRELSVNGFYRLGKHLGKSYNASIDHDVSVIYFQEMTALKEQLQQEAAQRAAALVKAPQQQDPNRDGSGSSSSSSSNGSSTGVHNGQRPRRWSPSGGLQEATADGGLAAEVDSDDEDEEEYQQWLSSGSKGSLVQEMREQGVWVSGPDGEGAGGGRNGGTGANRDGESGYSSVSSSSSEGAESSKETSGASQQGIGQRRTWIGWVRREPRPKHTNSTE